MTIYNEAKKRGLIHEPRWKNPINRFKYGVEVAKANLNNVYKRLRMPDWQSFVDLNMHMTTMLRGGDYVVAVWDGKGGITPGGTHHGLTMAKPIVGMENICIINTGINNLGTRGDYGEYNNKIQNPTVSIDQKEKYQKEHVDAVERWQHSSYLRRR